MSMPDCPNATPALDERAGWYCKVGCGGNCHNGVVLPSTEKNVDLSRVTASGAGQLRGAAAQATRSELSQDDLPILQAIAAMEESPFTPGQVVWKERTYYGVTAWQPFTIIDRERAICRAVVIVEGQVKEICDTLIINRGFKESVRDRAPKPAPGATIHYAGTEMVVYHSGTTEDSIWLMEPGATVAKPYDWPPAMAVPEEAFDGDSDSTNFRGSGDSDSKGSAIATGDRRTSDGDSDSTNSRGSGELWQECGPYESKGRTYYRYRWGRGHKIEGTRHIPGGLLTREKVASRASRVYLALHVEGKSHNEIVEMIDEWRGARC
ncbi:hypothetical protein IQ254_10665 [Nodosilinea sp. LEGE 07088]|uniref:hypothetical protein n=1 Tax=Nodosilinea sp. LEGE 07088 TaxID=2777968 RepID=UPI0018820E7D|nr:hypothetical protein [Nodosilinea sp. LEGE 07088]MBE9137671.1 hypothetical protein [Nodosilinea sp. LEGE 07088]